MRFSTFALVSLVFTSASACADMPVPTDGDLPPDAMVPDAGPTPDAGPVPDAPTPDAMVEPDAPTMPEIDLSTPEGFAHAQAMMICAAWEVCGECDAPTAACVETMTGRFTRNPPAPGAYHPDEAEAYLGLLEDTFATCEWPAEAEAAQLVPFHGELEAGELCTESSQCASTWCAAANVGDAWTCLVRTNTNRSPLCR